MSFRLLRFARKDSRAWQRGSAQGALLFLWMALVVLVIVLQMGAPAPVPADAPLNVFSSARAMRHVEAIGQAPHPASTPEHDRVRDYLLGELRGLGLDPEVQAATALNPVLGSAGRVENIVARVEGTRGSGVILVCGHYDSAPSEPGAGDDGVGVATMLETLRALREGPPPSSDFVFLFADGEEDGLLGSIAFIKEHPLASEVEVVLDFDGIGGRGPAILAWTAAGDGWLAPRLAASYPRMFMASWLNLVMRDSDSTDLDSFARAGYAGAHVDNLNGSTAYHTMLDRPGNVEESRLQAQGEAMTALLRGLGEEEPGGARPRDDVFFRTFDGMVVDYASGWVIPLAILTSLVFAGVLLLLRRRGRLSPGRLARGSLAYLGLIGSSLAIAALAWYLLRGLHPEARYFFGHDFYKSGFIMGAVIALALAVLFYLLPRIGRRVEETDLYAGTLLVWEVLLLASMALPLSSFAFTWPLLSALPVLARMGMSSQRTALLRSRWEVALLAVSCLPGLVIFVPVILAGSVFVTKLGAVLPVALLLLLAGPLLPHLSSMTRTRRPWAAWACLALAVVLILTGTLSDGFDASHPRPVSLFYLLDADEGRPVWASTDGSPGEWTAQFFPGGARKSSLKELLPVTRYDRDLLTCVAPDAGLAAPRLELLEKIQDGDGYTLRVRLSSPRQAWRAYILPGTDTHIETVALEGREAEKIETPFFSFTNLPPEGVVLTLEVSAPRGPELIVADESLGLPDFGDLEYEAAPDDVMPAPFPEEISGWPAFVEQTCKF